MEFNRQPSSRGTLVEMRALRADDFDALFAAASDEAIWDQSPEDRSDPATFRTFFDERLADGGALLLSDPRTGDVIGTTSFIGLNPDASEIEIGYTFLVRSRWGDGTNAELKEIMLRYVLAYVENVVFMIAMTNHRSQAAVRKLGAEQLQPRKSSSGAMFDTFRITRSDFQLARTPFTVGAALSRTFALYRRNWWKYIAYSAGLFVLFDVLQLALRGGGGGAGLGIASALLSAQFVAMADPKPAGAAPDVRPSGRIIGVSFVAGLAVLAGLVLLVVPGLVLATLWSLHQPLVLREDRGWKESLTRSWALVRPHFWKTFGTLAVIGVIWAGLLVAYGIALVALGSNSAWDETDWQTIVGDALFLAPAFPLFPLATAALYDLIVPRRAAT